MNQDPRYGAITATYNSGAPFAFSDGHAKSMVPYATDPNPYKAANVYQPYFAAGITNGHDPYNMWDAYR